MLSDRRLWRRAPLVLVAALALLVAVPWSAMAEPTTPVTYPAWASATMYTGQAFDTCTAPPLTTMQAWTASPYRGIGIYVGGENRTCAQPELTPGWVRAVADLGWRLIPIYKGLQPPCGGKPTDSKIVPSAARAQGIAAADDASQQVKALGMFRGGAIYYDMEHYTTTDSACRTAVLTFVSAWTKELHRLGYVSGVYENLNLGAGDLAGVYNSSAYARPDALWIARYDLDPALTGWAGIADNLWAVHQRAKQYEADFTATYGGVKLAIDADAWDGPVATMAFSYQATAVVRARSGPGPSYPLVKQYPNGASLAVVCQTPGPSVGTTTVWDKLNNGSYVTDNYVSTPSKVGYSAPVTRCLYPYQVTPSKGANERRGPGASHPVTGGLPGGALAWLFCQKAGSKVGSTSIWDKIDSQHWVSDNWVATPGSSYTKPVPRC
ncbi:MAG: glycoside hydrolase domain-containing protein [Streptosporangiaceae bacterium]